MKDAVGKNEEKDLLLHEPIRNRGSARADQISGPSNFMFHLQLLPGSDTSEDTEKISAMNNCTIMCPKGTFLPNLRHLVLGRGH